LRKLQISPIRIAKLFEHIVLGNFLYMSEKCIWNSVKYTGKNQPERVNYKYNSEAVTGKETKQKHRDVCENRFLNNTE
jgi:hypothetical protein